MVHVNPANVINMLIVSFQISNFPQTSVNNKEIELHDTIKDIIQNTMDDLSFAMETDTTLEFENYWDANIYDAEFVGADEVEELEENDEDEEEDTCTPEKEIVKSSGKVEKRDITLYQQYKIVLKR